MRCLLALTVLFASTVHALTASEIDDAAAGAHNGLRTVVRRLASKSFGGRDNTTPGSLAARTYLIRKLRRLGMGLNGAGTEDAAYQQPFTHGGQTGTNLLAVMPGKDLAGEYVMIGVHYDHLDSRSSDGGACAASGQPGGRICNGAAGLRVLLHRPVGGERGGEGVHQLRHPGGESPPIGQEREFRGGRRDRRLGLRGHGRPSRAGRGARHAAPLVHLRASFTDLERVAGVVAAGQVDLDFFSPADQALLQGINTTLQGLVADGPGAFDAQDVGTVLQAAIDTVNALRRVPCQKF